MIKPIPNSYWKQRKQLEVSNRSRKWVGMGAVHLAGNLNKPHRKSIENLDCFLNPKTLHIFRFRDVACVSLWLNSVKLLFGNYFRWRSWCLKAAGCWPESDKEVAGELKTTGIGVGKLWCFSTSGRLEDCFWSFLGLEKKIDTAASFFS